MKNETDARVVEVRKYLDAGAEARIKVDPKQVVEVADEMANRLLAGGQLITMGNGGAAADAQHFAAELVGMFEVKDRRPIPAIALTTNSSSVTAIANDFGFENVFLRQTRAFVRKGDVVFILSAFGNSQNSVVAAEAAKKMGAYVVGLAGGDGGKLKAFADKMIIVDAKRTSIIQEVHVAVYHLLSKLIEDKL